MKNHKKTHFVFFALSIGLLMIIILSHETSADTIIVAKDNSGDYNNIQDAINDANPGDQIRVYSGTYEENIHIDQSISITGNGSSATTILGKFTDNVVVISSDSVAISGFSIIGKNASESYSGIYVESDYSNISMNKCSNNSYGVYFYKSNHNVISNNIVEENGQIGIYLRDSSNNTFSSNVCDSNNGPGLFIRDSENNNFSGMIASNNRNYGIFTRSSCNNTYSQITVQNSNEGISLRDSVNSSIVNCILFNNGIGIRLYDTSECIIVNNTFSNNNREFLLVASEENDILLNSLFENSIGIELDRNSISNTIKYNNIFDNSDFGLYIDREPNENVNASNNWWGDPTGPYHNTINPDGQGDNISDYVSIEPWLEELSYSIPPTVIITSEYFGVIREGDEVFFSGEAISFSKIIRYVWTSQIDGEIYNDTSTSFSTSLLSNGTHSIKFKAEDENHIWSKEAQVNVIVNGIPIATIVTIQPNPAIISQIISFIGSGSDDGEIQRYRWRTDSVELWNDTPSDFNTSDIPAGVYTIFFSVQDNYGFWSAEDSFELIVHEQPISIIESIYPNPALDSDVIHFIANGSDDGTISQYTWRSSIDGEYYNGTNQSFTYSDLSVGNHTIYLRVLDDYGEWSEEVQDVLVIHLKPVAIITSIIPNPALDNDTISFNGTGTDDGIIRRYSWRTNTNGLHNDSHPWFSLSDFSPGSLTVYLKVQDNYGVWSDEVSTTLIIHAQPVAFIEFIGPNPGIVGEPISFIGNGTDDGTIGRYVWRTNETELHNGTTSEFSISILPVGTHTVYLRVQDNYGVWSEVVSAILIVHERPVATIESILPNPAIGTIQVTFSANGTDDGEIVKYVWREGEEELYNGTDAEFSTSDFAQGIHTIYLKVQDNYGVWSEEVSQDIEILADSDLDGIADMYDAFPEDSAASKDSDGDGYPDEWNEGKTEKDSTTGLKLDKYPNDSKKWKMEDDDGGLLSGFELGISILIICIAIFYIEYKKM